MEWADNSKNDVWWSTDGINWNLATANASWTPRHGHEAFVYDNKMWVIGGNDNLGFQDDVWWSVDGVNWNLSTANPGFSGRTNFASTVYNNKMWIMGGYNGYYFSDVWWSQ